MKRMMLILLALCLLAGGSACRGDGAPKQKLAADREKSSSRPELTFCVDLNTKTGYDPSGDMKDFLKEYVPEYQKDFNVTVESLTSGGENRESAITRIRTEMMAGTGPDLFVCACPAPLDPLTAQDLSIPISTGLFAYPRALMDRSIFLPLDDYIEKAEDVEWDKLYPKIMEAGRNEKGQQLLPLGWTTVAGLFDKEEYALTEELPMTWDQMLQSQDPGVQSACWDWEFGGSLGVLADYEKDAPRFTLEELAGQLEGARENQERRMAGEFDEGQGITGMFLGRPNPSHICWKGPDFIMIPQYNRDGGVTAYVTAFGAVNANTKYPREAFRILEALLTTKVQQHAKVFSWVNGLPVHRELLSEDFKVDEAFDWHNKTYQKWYLSQWNHRQLQDLAEQVNAVDFFTPMNQELTDLWSEYVQEEDPEKRHQLVEDHYATLKMMLAES